MFILSIRFSKNILLRHNHIQNNFDWDKNETESDCYGLKHTRWVSSSSYSGSARALLCSSLLTSQCPWQNYTFTFSLLNVLDTPQHPCVLGLSSYCQLLEHLWAQWHSNRKIGDVTIFLISVVILIVLKPQKCAILLPSQKTVTVLVRQHPSIMMNRGRGGQWTQWTASQSQ